MIRFALLLFMSLAVSSQAFAAVKWNNSSNNSNSKVTNPILQPDLAFPKMEKTQLYLVSSRKMASVSNITGKRNSSNMKKNAISNSSAL